MLLPSRTVEGRLLLANSWNGEWHRCPSCREIDSSTIETATWIDRKQEHRNRITNDNNEYDRNRSRIINDITFFIEYGQFEI
jgi:hypothetical protein